MMLYAFQSNNFLQKKKKKRLDFIVNASEWLGPIFVFSIFQVIVVIQLCLWWKYSPKKIFCHVWQVKCKWSNIFLNLLFTLRHLTTVEWLTTKFLSKLQCCLFENSHSFFPNSIMVFAVNKDKCCWISRITSQIVCPVNCLYSSTVKLKLLFFKKRLGFADTI